MNRSETALANHSSVKEVFGESRITLETLQSMMKLFGKTTTRKWLDYASNPPTPHSVFQLQPDDTIIESVPLYYDADTPLEAVLTVFIAVVGVLKNSDQWPNILLKLGQVKAQTANYEEEDIIQYWMQEKVIKDIHITPSEIIDEMKSLGVIVARKRVNSPRQEPLVSFTFHVNESLYPNIGKLAQTQASTEMLALLQMFDYLSRDIAAQTTAIIKATSTFLQEPPAQSL